MSTNRLEAFSDGVFAIAITLLVLELNVPTGDDLWHQLKDEWPSFAAFFVSFWVIGIIWVNHHGVLDHLARADRGVLYLNLLLLFTVVFIPFPTALLAEHLKSGKDEHVAAFVYSGAFLAMSLAYGFLWSYITNRKQLLGVELSDDEIRHVSRRFQIGTPFYAVQLAMAFISPAVVLVINAALAVYYMVAGMRSPVADADRRAG
ncbi:MAG: TMEM175 family protein [Solirubrobacterales bacterium]